MSSSGVREKESFSCAKGEAFLFLVVLRAIYLICMETCFPAGFELTVTDGESQSSLPPGLWVQVGASSSDIEDC